MMAQKTSLPVHFCFSLSCLVFAVWKVLFLKIFLNRVVKVPANSGNPVVN